MHPTKIIKLGQVRCGPGCGHRGPPGTAGGTVCLRTLSSRSESKEGFAEWGQGVTGVGLEDGGPGEA